MTPSVKKVDSTPTTRSQRIVVQSPTGIGKIKSTPTTKRNQVSSGYENPDAKQVSSSSDSPPVRKKRSLTSRAKEVC